MVDGFYAGSWVRDGNLKLIRFYARDEDGSDELELVSVPYKIAGKAEWQKITVELPVKEKTSILRLYLPSGSAAVELDEIILRPEAGPPRSWNF